MEILLLASCKSEVNSLAIVNYQLILSLCPQLTLFLLYILICMSLTVQTSECMPYSAEV